MLWGGKRGKNEWRGKAFYAAWRQNLLEDGGNNNNKRRFQPILAPKRLQACRDSFTRVANWQCKKKNQKKKKNVEIHLQESLSQSPSSPFAWVPFNFVPVPEDSKCPNGRLCLFTRLHDCSKKVWVVVVVKDETKLAHRLFKSKRPLCCIISVMNDAHSVLSLVCGLLAPGGNCYRVQRRL